MRVLFLTLGAPYPPDSGVKIRDYNIIKQISRRHTVTLLSLLYTEDEIQPLQQLRQFCRAVDYVVMRPRSISERALQILPHLLERRPLATYPFYYREMAEKIRQHVKDQGADLIQIEHSFLAPYVEAIPRASGCKTILSLHNLGVRQYARMRSLKMPVLEKGIFWVKWLTMLGWEAKYASQFDRSLVVSELEGELLRRANPSLQVAVIENGCDIEFHTPLPESPDGQVLLYVGTLGYPPNVDAVLSFCETTLPLIRQQVPDIKFIVVGHRPPPEVQRLAERGDVMITGSVSDLLPYYRQAKVCIVPLRAGGGTRLKILEAMSLGRPVLTTSIGCEGLKVRDKENLLIADTPAEFAERAVQLLRDAELRRHLTEKARLLVETNYDWAVISQQLLRVYEEVAGQRRAATN
jgi:sugar transferase (PEP-CTERM/EpsH1 system associated)